MIIHSLYDLKKEYRSKKIYIWNINRDSINVFVLLAFRRIDIQGFITIQKEYEGDIYMNRPVFGLRNLELDDDSIIIMADQVPEEHIGMLPAGKSVYWSDAVGINEELRSMRLIIYGIGYGADKMCSMLRKENIKEELYCVTQKSNIEVYNGKKVIEAEELANYEGYAIVISTITPQYRKEILETLYKSPCSVYVEHTIVGEKNSEFIQHLNFIQSIDFAVKSNKKIYLYSQKNPLADLIEEVLNNYGIKINGYVHDIANKAQDIESIHELAYEGKKDILVIINEESPDCLIRARENLELAGFSLEDENYTGIQWYSRGNEALLSKLPYYRDSLVGFNIIYPQGKPGWKIYGKEREDSINIVVLGGSTSAEVYYPENWISRLYYKLKHDNIITTIYNGAFESNGIVEELLRLLRDGYALKPQIVISLSGVNDLKYRESANQFNEVPYINWIKSVSSDGKYCSGVYSDESLYSFWNRNMKLLKMIAESYEAKFFGFLQPMNFTMSDMSLREKSLYEVDAQIEGARDFAQSVSDDENYINLMSLFHHQDGMYFDFCHYTGKAHEIIANIVYETIMPTIQTLI